MRALRASGLSILACLLFVPAARAQAATEYRLSFADYVRHVVDVEAVFTEVTADPVEIHMSRSSPGRYALHEFAKNVYDVQISDGAGRPLASTQPTLHVWRVKEHGGTIRVRYKVFGDRIDGTYLGVDYTQAHINIPATLMWAKTLETRPARLTFVPPPDVSWTVATQLYPTQDPLVFTAPNLSYLMDSPVQFGPQVLRTFQVAPIAGSSGAPQTIRIALRHDGSDAEATRLAQKVEKVVREAQAVYGELPAFEPGSYTFLATYAPGANGDGMEHRNSTVVTSSTGLTGGERGALNTVSHEFFHAWNVERIRPRSLEPFNFDDANVSGELWLAEGFTQYYGPLLLRRAGLQSDEETLAEIASLIDAVSASPGRRARSAPEMSRLAPFVDAACSVDPTNWSNTYLSYYTFGAAIALGLDLELRDRSDGKATLDDFMRALWTKYGKAPGAPGVVARPYTPADLEATLAEVSGSAAFAREVFERYVDGLELVEYGRLLDRMGLVLRPRFPNRAWMGDLSVASGPTGAVVLRAAQANTPAYDAGLGEGDVIVSIGAAPVRGPGDVNRMVDGAKPGDRLDVTYVRAGKEHKATIVLRADPGRELVTRESLGEKATAEQLRMRAAWLGSRVK